MRSNGDYITNLHKPFFPLLRDYIQFGDGTLYCFFPFITTSVINELIDSCDGRDVIIITSWRLDHLKSGVSSLSLYELCRSRGWHLFINSRLHAKVISNSFKTCILTSANCTESALRRNDGNIEFLVYNEISSMNRIEFNRIIELSIPVNDSIYNQYLDWYDNMKSDLTYIEKDLELTDNHLIYTHQLPASFSPLLLWNYIQGIQDEDYPLDLIEHDLAIYSPTMDYSTYDEWFQAVRSVFLDHPFIQIIDSNITSNGIQFGLFKRVIRDNCVDDPVPYAKDLTSLTKNLFNWFVFLFPERYEIRIPGRHSECLYRKQ